MDGKTKKILNYLKKNGDEAEALDVSFGLNMDEDFVQNALDSLVQENLVASTRNDQGKVLYKLAEGGGAAEKKSAPVSEESPKKAKKGKAVAGPEDHFDEFVLENEAVNMVTDTIATHIDDLPSFQTATPAAPASVPLAPAPTTDFLVADGFSPKPKKEKKPAPQPSIDADDDDFSPKPKKKSKEKVAEFDGGIPHDDDGGGSKAKLPVNLIAAAVAGVILLIVAVVLSVAVSGGKTASAIKNAENDYIKTLDFDNYKAETAAKISKLEAENDTLKTQVKSLESKIKAPDKPAAAKKGRKK